MYYYKQNYYIYILIIHESLCYTLNKNQLSIEFIKKIKSCMSECIINNSFDN